jgi:hypothetical protein
MPKELHDKLEKTAKSKGLKGKQKDAYVYGTMSQIKKKPKKTILG